MPQQNSKILIVSRFIPYPPNDGGKICIFGFIDSLRYKYDFTIFFPVFNTNEIKAAGLLQKEWANVKVKYIKLLDEPEISFRFKQRLKRKLRVLYSRVLSILASINLKKSKTASEEKNENLLENFDFTYPFYPFPESFIRSLNAIIDDTSFDIIQVLFTRNLNLFSLLPKKSVIVYEQIEQRFDVLKDYCDAKQYPAFIKNYYVGNCEFAENTYINQYDAVFSLNNKDSEYLKKHTNKPVIFTSPFGILNKDIIPSINNSFKPNKIVFSGHEGHYPNYDAVDWYLANVHEEIHSRFNFNFYITGYWSEKTKIEISKKYSNVKFADMVTDYQSFLLNSIMAVPIRIGGGGLRTKILYAMGNGAPVISTSIGAFGIDVTDKKNILIADQPQDYINAVESLTKHPAYALEIVANAYQLITQNYSQTATASRRDNYYQELLSLNFKKNSHN